MSETRSVSKNGFRTFALVLGVALFGYLVMRTGPRVLWHEIRSVRYGIPIIIALGGLTHLVKTWAWRKTFTCDISRLSWRRSFGMRLVSEAIGQLGIIGKFLGEGVRVSLLGSAVPTAHAISAAALDSLLYILASICVTVMAVAVSFFVLPLPGKLRVYGVVFAAIFSAVLVLAALAVNKGWRVMGATFRAIEKIPGCGDWVRRKQQVIDETESNLLSFHREAPAAFRASFFLNFLAHGLAIAEIYVVLSFLTPKATPLGALVLEGMTKLINTVGALNPGNVGTYEGGNVLIGRLFGLTAATGLTLALCRRARALFWGAIGSGCLIIMRRPDKNGETELKTKEKSTSAKAATPVQKNSLTTVIILEGEERKSGFVPEIARVATLPVLLRTILAFRAFKPGRLIVSTRPTSTERIKSALAATGRLPELEWRESEPPDLVPLIAEAAATSEKIVLVMGDRTYQPRLLESAVEWNGRDAMTMASAGELAGVYVLSQATAHAIAESPLPIPGFPELHNWLRWRESVEVNEIPANLWHRITGPKDLPVVERKLDSWLIKPTDGIFARMNRRVSTPISRQLLRFPITPNQVSLFVLGVSLACGFFYGRGGYWNCLIGALLAVAGSILDGCDGEVARLKLQSTAFGTWVDTICDYIYYVVAFGGMTFGLARSSGLKSYLAWGGALLVGALGTFFTVSLSRQRLAGARPEKLLAVWQQKAESRSSNPFLYFGRNTEFIIRRCFHPYALVFFALINATNVAFVTAAVGANIAFLIALYAHLDFTRPTSPRTGPDPAPAINSGVIA